MTEAAGGSDSSRKLRTRVPLDANHRADDQLSDPHPAGDGEGFAAVIHQQDLYLAAIITIDRSRGIEHRDAVSGGQSGAGADLRFQAFGQGDGDAAGNQLKCARLENDRRVDDGWQIEAGRAGCRISGKWIVGGEPLDRNRKYGHASIYT